MSETSPQPPLFTRPFFTLCGFSFVVFLSAFMMLPTAPLRILSLQGSTLAAGSFLGLLTYASAFSATVTGALGDRIGRRRMLVVCSLVLAGFAIAYAVAPRPWVILTLVAVHGVFWSGLLSGSAAYITGVIPESRRAEGIGYWGLSTMLSIAVAPNVGVWLYQRGWWMVCVAAAAFNLGMAAIAFSLEEQPRSGAGQPFLSRNLLEWRVLLASLTLFLYSFGYGGITSFVVIYAQANKVVPAGLYLTALAVVVLASRPLVVPLSVRFGPRAILVPCFLLMPVGLGLLAWSGTFWMLLFSALVFGLGFGSAYPVFAAYVTRPVGPLRRGAAFGAILAAFDTGIGTGSICAGWLIGHSGFRAAYGTAAVVAALALPYFLWIERRLLSRAPVARAA